MTTASGFKRSRKLSRLYGFIIGITAFTIVIIVLSQIKVTNYAVYKIPSARIQVEYPTHWDIVPNPGVPNALAAFLAPRESEWQVFTPNINISIQPLEGKLFNFDVFSNEAVRQITGVFESAIKVLERRNTVYAGRKAYRFIYMGHSPDMDLPDPMKFMHVWFFVDNRAYIFTYSALNSQFRKHRAVAEHLINSFKTF